MMISYESYELSSMAHTFLAGETLPNLDNAIIKHTLGEISKDTETMDKDDFDTYTEGREYHNAMTIEGTNDILITYFDRSKMTEYQGGDNDELTFSRTHEADYCLILDEDLIAALQGINGSTYKTMPYRILEGDKTPTIQPLSWDGTYNPSPDNIIATQKQAINHNYALAPFPKRLGFMTDLYLDEELEAAFKHTATIDKRHNQSRADANRIAKLRKLAKRGTLPPHLMEELDALS